MNRNANEIGKTEKTTDVKLVKTEIKPEVKPGKTQEELLMENEILRKKLASIPNDLEGRISLYKKQEQNLKQLDKISGIVKVLTGVLDGIAAESENLEGPKYSIDISSQSSGYSKSNLVSITNSKTVEDITKSLVFSLQMREDEIKALLLA